MGVVGLCNLLVSHGHKVRGMNLAVERMLEPGFDSRAWLAAQPAAELVLLDLHWHEHALGAVELAGRVRAAWPEARVVLGGLTASAFAGELLALCPAVDAVILGDAERPLVTLARAMASGDSWPPRAVPNLLARSARRPERWVATPADLGTADFVDLGFLDHRGAYQRLLHSHPRRSGTPPQVGASGHWLSNGRGCAWTCASCGGGRGAHRVLSGRASPTWRAPLAVATDLARLRADGVQQVALGLDPDMAGAEHRDASLGVLPDLGLYVESFQLPSRGLLDLLVQGCDLDHTELALTAVSGDTALRRLHGKAFDNPALLSTLTSLQARGLSASLFFSLGLPGEDERAFEATLALARRALELDQLGLLRLAALPQALDPLAPMGLGPGAWGLEPTDAGDLAARLARARRVARGDIHPLSPDALGYRVSGCDLPSRAVRWNELAAAAPPGALIPVPGL